MDITDILKGVLNGGFPMPSQNQNRQNSGMSSVLKMALPVILLSLFKNIQSKKKSDSLAQALDQHQTEDSGDWISSLQKADETDGGKILGHVLGSDKNDLVEQIAQKAGVSTTDAESAISKLMPVIMEMLANKTTGDRSQSNLSNVVRDQIEKVDKEETLPNLSQTIKEMLGGNTEPEADNNGGFLDQIFGNRNEEDDNTDGGGLLDSLGGKGIFGDLIGSILGGNR